MVYQLMRLLGGVSFDFTEFLKRNCMIHCNITINDKRVWPPGRISYEITRREFQLLRRTLIDPHRCVGSINITGWIDDAYRGDQSDQDLYHVVDGKVQTQMSPLLDNALRYRRYKSQPQRQAQRAYMIVFGFGADQNSEAKQSQEIRALSPSARSIFESKLDEHGFHYMNTLLNSNPEDEVLPSLLQQNINMLRGEIHDKIIDILRRLNPGEFSAVRRYLESPSLESVIEAILWSPSRIYLENRLDVVSFEEDPGKIEAAFNRLKEFKDFYRWLADTMADAQGFDSKAYLGSQFTFERFYEAIHEATLDNLRVGDAFDTFVISAWSQAIKIFGARSLLETEKYVRSLDELLWYSPNVKSLCQSDVSEWDIRRYIDKATEIAKNPLSPQQVHKQLSAFKPWLATSKESLMPKQSQDLVDAAVEFYDGSHVVSIRILLGISVEDLTAYIGSYHFNRPSLILRYPADSRLSQFVTENQMFASITYPNAFCIDVFRSNYCSCDDLYDYFSDALPSREEMCV